MGSGGRPVAAIRLFRPSEEGPSTLTVGDIIGLYLRHCAAENVHSTAARADREFTFKLFVAACGHIPIADAKPFHLSDFIISRPSWASPSTRRSRANHVKAAFQWAADQERIERNPFAKVSFKESERRPDMPDDTLAVIENVASKPVERALRFLRLTGCRVSELCEATWADVDLDRGAWTIQRHKSRRYTGKPKVVALVGEAVALLRSVAVAAAPAAAPMLAGDTEHPAATDHIFVNNYGTPWKRQALAQQLRRIKKRAGIQTKAGLHSIRHTVGTSMFESGATPKEVAEQLGHATSSVTERFYYNRTPAMLERMKAALSRAVPKSEAHPAGKDVS
jgi:integrase